MKNADAYSEHKKHSKKAYKGQYLMNGGCSAIYNLICPMLDFEADDAHVFIQDGDGLVLCWNHNNTPTIDIIKAFEEKGSQLNEDDLYQISI